MIASFVQGRPVIGALLAVFVTLALLDLLSIRRGNGPVLAFCIYFVAALIAIVYGMHDLGVKGSYWCFPVPLCLHFIASRKSARVLNVVFVVATSTAAIAFFGTNVAVRFVATLVMVSFFADRLIVVGPHLGVFAVHDSLSRQFHRPEYHAYSTERYTHVAVYAVCIPI